MTPDEAFEKFYQQLRPRAIKLAERRGLSRDDAEGIVEAIFASIYISLREGGITPEGFLGKLLEEIPQLAKTRRQFRREVLLRRNLPLEGLRMLR